MLKHGLILRPPEPAAPRAVDDSVIDYPRPTRPADEQQEHEPHHQEDVPKKEKKRANHETEKKMKHQKAEATRPTRDGHFDHKGFGAGGRIAQPGGKVLST